MPAKFAVGDKVLSHHGPQLYDARVNEVQERGDGDGGVAYTYLLHYKGWKNTWDEWLQEDEVLPRDAASLAEKKALERQAAEKQSEVGSKRKAASRKGKVAHQRVEPYIDSEPVPAGVRVPVPSTIQKRLCMELDLMKQSKLVSIPCTPSVSSILRDYAEYRERRKQKIAQSAATVKEVAAMMQDLTRYFDLALPSCLLYRPEKLQHYKHMEENKGARPADMYGGEHLLRLFVKLPWLFSWAGVSSEDATELNQVMTDLMKFVERNVETYLVNDYFDADASYLKKAEAFAG